MAKDLQFHPAAAIFPLLSGDRFDELVESIRKHGLLESIKTHDGQVIDGRNRYKACLLAGKEPHYEPASVNGSAADYVYAMNNDRRHLSPGARAMAAARYKDQCAKEAKERQRKHGGTAPGKKKNTSGKDTGSDSRDVAGEKFDVSGKTVDFASKILAKAAPEVVAAVESGDLPVSTAARLADAPKTEQRKAVQAGRAAIRSVIRNHSPSVNEEARNDPGVKWSKSLREIRSRLASTRELGGIKELTTRWTQPQIEEYRNDVRDIIKELEEWEAALTIRLTKSSKA